MDETEHRLAGGWVNEVARVGDTVRRSTGPWTPAVHALLRHLEAKGFDAAPRVLGFDEQGREVLTYIEGAPGMHPWPPELTTNEGLAALARLLRRYHDAVADFRPPSDAEWRIGTVEMQPGDVVIHGDAGPWNTIWRAGEPVALIDWDFAEPAPAINDLAFMAWYTVPLGSGGPGTPQDLERRSRLHTICRTYGVSAGALLDAVAIVQARDLERDLRFGGAGIEPWAGFLAQDEPAFFRLSMEWLRQNRGRLL